MHFIASSSLSARPTHTIHALPKGIHFLHTTKPATRPASTITAFSEVQDGICVESRPSGAPHLLAEDVSDVHVAVCELVGVCCTAAMCLAAVDEASHLQHLPGQRHVITLAWQCSALQPGASRTEVRLKLRAYVSK
jgi:hypothetical protein